jgi:hypothetical protein
MARARGKGSLIFCDVTRSVTSQKQFLKKQKQKQIKWKQLTKKSII